MHNYLQQVSVFVSIFLLLAASLNLVLGFGGIFSIMQAVFYGVGAYTTAILVVNAHTPFPLELAAAFVVGAAIAAALAGLIIRLSAELVIIATLALQLIFSTIFRNWSAVTGGNYGIFGIGRPSVFGVPVLSVGAYSALAAGVALFCFVVTLGVARSSFGLALRAQREDPLLAASLGHDPARERTYVFVFAAGLAAVAGGLYAQFVGYIDPTSFDVTQSLGIITIVVVGGLANLWGTLGAAVILTFLPQLLILLPATSDAAAQLQLLLYGLILVVIVRFWPRGLIPERPAVRAAHVRDDVASGAKTPREGLDRLESLAVTRVAQPAPAIRVVDVSKRFGGIRAVDGLSLEIEPGRVTALIGPNGAGKTTLFNLMCGVLHPDSGRISLGTRETTRLRPYEIARLGVTRTFQDVRIFPRLTALENVVFALPSADPERALRRLADVGLRDDADREAGNLSYAQQKLLMIAIVLAREDPVVCLDEIAAGLDHRSVRAFAGLIRRIAASGRTVCLVEHNLSFVWEVADTVFVLDQGRIVASGLPAEIQANPTVVEIYFGQRTLPARP